MAHVEVEATGEGGQMPYESPTIRVLGTVTDLTAVPNGPIASPNGPPFPIEE